MHVYCTCAFSLCQGKKGKKGGKKGKKVLLFVVTCTCTLYVSCMYTVEPL